MVGKMDYAKQRTAVGKEWTKRHKPELREMEPEMMTRDIREQHGQIIP